MDAEAGSPVVVVGRDQVLARIAATLSGGAPAGAGTVVITGPPGAGKTVIAREAARRVESARVLIGAGLPLSSVSVPFLPFRAMLRAADGDAPVDFDAPPAQVIVAIDRWIDGLTATSRTIIVADDLHWADSASLDVLLYLASGAPDRPLGIVATVRDEQPGQYRPVDRWLAGVQRVPRCDIVPLGPLDRAGTEEQIAVVLGTPPHESLVEDVWAHTRGVPYLTALAIAGLDREARRLPESMPDDLVDAVERSMHGLGQEAVTLLRILAVGGRSMTAEQLRDVLGADRPDVMADRGLVEQRLAEAAEMGTIAPVADGAYWFGHPLAAEVLEAQLSDVERAAWHRAFLQVDERVAPEAQGYEEIGRIADHAAASGDPVAAYRWSLIASRRATEAGADGQALRLVQRALRLHSTVGDVVESERDLLNDVRRCASACAAMEAEVDAIDRLLASTDDRAVLERSELTARRMLLQTGMQRGNPDPADIAALLALTAEHRTSWQRAYSLALVTLWNAGSDDGADALAGSLACAERSGDELATAWSLAAAVDHAMWVRDAPTAARLGPLAIAAALRAGDGIAYNVAVQGMAAAAFGEGTAEFAEMLGRHRRVAAGVLPHNYVAWLAMIEADSWLRLGYWAECATALRFTIGDMPFRTLDLTVRSIAGRLATRQGRFDVADGQFARLAELYSGETQLAAEIHLGRAELALERGDVLEAARGLSSLDDQGLHGRNAECTTIAMRAVADARAQRGGSVAEEVERLIGDMAFAVDFPAGRDGADALRRPEASIAISHLHLAERTRAEGGDDAPARWIDAADACAAVSWPWEEAYSCRRAAEALLVAGRPDRAAAAPVLRRGLDIAIRLGAEPQERALRELARFARIPVAARPHRESSSPPTQPSIDGLTPRETEIVALVSAGRTYREIARELFLSEKTVSSHISKILRKTGASNRIDLAQRATAATNPT